MPSPLVNLPVGDDYDEALKLEDQRGGPYFGVRLRLSGAVAYELLGASGWGTEKYEATFGGTLDTGEIYGIRFRNWIAGTPAQLAYAELLRAGQRDSGGPLPYDIDDTGKVVPQNPVTANFDADLAADVAMPLANTYYGGPSLALPAGTYLVIGKVLVLPGAAADKITAALQAHLQVDSNYDTTEIGGSSVIALRELVLTSIVTLTGSATIAINVASTGVNATLKAGVIDNPPPGVIGPVPTASSLVAIQL